MGYVNYKSSSCVSKVTQDEFYEDTAVCRVTGRRLMEPTNLNVIEGLKNKIFKKEKNISLFLVLHLNLFNKARFSWGEEISF